MQHAKNTKANDAVTKLQLQRFLPKADVPNPWKSKLKNFKHILDMPIYLQDKLFADFISQHVKEIDNDFPSGKHYQNVKLIVSLLRSSR